MPASTSPGACAATIHSATPTPAERDAVRALARASRVLERASGDLSLPHYRVLAAVASGDQRASRVASRLALGRPAISAAVESLGQRGLLDRVEVEGDGRAAALSVTTAGRQTLDRAEAEMASRLRELAARAPDPPRLLEALAWLGPAIDELHEARRQAESTTTKEPDAR